MEVKALLPVQGQGVTEMEFQVRVRHGLLPGVVLPLLPRAAVRLGRRALGALLGDKAQRRPRWPEGQLRLHLHLFGTHLVMKLVHSQNSVVVLADDNTPPLRLCIYIHGL